MTLFQNIIPIEQVCDWKNIDLVLEENVSI